MRKIAVITATRAEYGLLKSLLKQIDSDVDLELQLLVTGTHLEEDFGLTYKEIEQDFVIDVKIKMDLEESNNRANSLAMAKLQMHLTEALSRLSPDIIVILGDRYEILSVASTATLLQIPLAHIHGGEVTEGAMDDSMRHAITKLSHLHFCAAEVYRKRVLQLGEEPQRVYNVGSLGVENIQNVQLLSREEFEASIEFPLKKCNLLITYHPETLSPLSAQEQMQTLLDALEQFCECGLIFTKANADAGGKVINAMIDEFVKKHSNSIAFTSLGQLRYLSALRYIDAVVGNSSSGILEVPSFHIPTINIGERQKGRVMAKSILNTALETETIVESIQKACEKRFVEELATMKSPFEGENCSFQIKEHLKNTPLEALRVKRFQDL